MIDTQETNLPEESKLEDSQALEVKPVVPDTEVQENIEEEVGELETTIESSEAKAEASEETTEAEELTDEERVAPLDAASLATITKPAIIERLELIVASPQNHARTEIDALKHAYYRIRRSELDEEKKAFLENGGTEDVFKASEDEFETKLKDLVAQYKEKRAAMAAEEERLKEANYLLKLSLIDRLKALTESQDDFNKRYNEFREIQRKWKEIKLIPQEHAKELWRNYQLYNEQFYDLVKINNQFRDYDFKKNLEMKTALCETVERLGEEPDTISVFHQLQKLHQQWKEIGPVAKEYRDSIWERFKAASTIINKRHQAHFDELKQKELKNLEEKVAICEELEAIDYESLKAMKDWEKKTEKVKELQEKWRNIGYATRKENARIFDRFRTACDKYFKQKINFYKSIKHEMEKNLEQRRILIEKAEALKDSTDWKETATAFVNLQNEWKKIGPVARKHSESTWKQFISACDHFFSRKNQSTTSQRSEETGNLAAKKELIEKINSIDETLNDEDALAKLRGHIAEWGQIGFVPFKEKDKIHHAFREAVDKQFDRLKVSERDRKIQQFRSTLTELAGEGKGKLYSERDKLMRTYDRMKSELQTYENNIGFFNVSSKGGGGMLKEMEHRIARLKEEMTVLVKKIEAIDENLDKED